MKEIFFIVINLGLAIGSSAQSYVRHFSPVSSNRGTAKVMHLQDDHYLLFRTLFEGDSETKTNRLQIIEYDYCGIVASSEVYLEGFWSIRMFGNIFMHKDSIRIPVWGSSPLSSHQEAGLLSIHPQNYNANYRGIQGKNVMYSFGIIPYLEDEYIIHGFVSYTDRPSEYVVLRVDRDFHVLKYYQNYGSGSVAGGCVVRDNEVYLFTNNHIIKFTSLLEPIWSREIASGYYSSNPRLVSNGIIYLASQYSNERQVFAVKMNFDGQLMWTTNSIGHQSENSRRSSLYKNTDGNFSVVTQDWSSDVGYGTIVIAHVDPETSEVIAEWEIDETVADSSLKIAGYLPEPNGGVLVGTTPDFKTTIIKYNLEEDAGSCALLLVNLQQPTLEYAINSEPTRPNKEGPFLRGSLRYSAMDNEAEMEEFCNTPLPKFNLLDDEFSLCGGKELTVNLSEIPFDIQWNDGSTEKIRTLKEEGNYDYSYEICGDYYGEEIKLKNDSCPCDWFIPNAFSPNSGTENNEYRIYNSCATLSNFSILIYNRWGGLMYASEDPAFRWDGTWKGKALQSGVFTYLLRYEDGERPGEQVRQGTIVLLR